MGLIQSRFVQSPLVNRVGLLKSAAAPATVTFIDTHGDTTNLTTYNFTDIPIGDAHPSREVFLAVHCRSNDGSGRQVSSGSIGGVSLRATHAHSESTAQTVEKTADLVSAAVPTGTTADIEIVMSGGCFDLDFAVYRAVNMKSTTPHDTIQNVYAAPASGQINIPADGFLIAVGSRVQSNDRVTWTGVTEAYDRNNIDSDAYGISGGFASGLALEANRTVEAQGGGAGNGLIAMCAASFA